MTMARKSPLTAYEEHVEKLVKCLPMDDTLFITKLSACKLLPGDTHSQLKTLPTRVDKASYFLDHVIKPALDIDDTSSFDDLLSVMEDCGYVHVEKLACKIKSVMNKRSKIEPGESSMHPFKTRRKRSNPDTGNRTNEASLDSSRSIESIESKHSDGNEDHIPPQPKKRRKVFKKSAVPKKTFRPCNVKTYKQKFNENDIESSFVYMLSKLKELWSNVEFSKLKDACLWDMRLSDELRNNLISVESLKGIFDLLSKTHFCTWLEIRILRSLANVADVPEAIQLINTFKECVYSRKCSEVLKHFKEQYINPDHFSVVSAKLNTDAECLVVADLIEYCHTLESILSQHRSSAIVSSKTGCLELCLVIPNYWHLRAYEVAKTRFLKLRPFNIQYLQIGTLPKVYATDLIRTTEANSLLKELSLHNEWEYPSQVINYYYTYLEGHMDADSVGHMMHSEHLITDSDYEVITAAPNDINMNRLLLQYVRAMDMAGLLKFCNLLKTIETHQCIGETLETSLKSTKSDESAVSKSECDILIPSKLMTSQFKDVNNIFLEVIDRLVAQLHTVDIVFLADTCCALMASDVHNIKLFNYGFIKKLFKCSHPSLLKIYLLPFITWLDNSILIELATAYEKFSVLELFCKFIHIIDDTEPITSYPMPTFSQLIIPLDDSEYTMVAVKTFQNCSELVLKDVKDVKELLTSHWELTAHALHLVAIDYHYNCMYWMIPKQVQYLVENRLNRGHHELGNKGILQIVLLPKNFFSANNGFDQQVIDDLFNVYYLPLKKSIKITKLTHKEAYEKYVEELIKCLPMDDFLFISKLSECQLLLRHTNEALRTQVAKASYFLDHVIKPALDIDDTSSFDNLLSVMEHSDYTNVKILASIIKSEFDKEADIKPELDIPNASVFVTLSNILRNTYKKIKLYVKEVEWLPSQAKFVVSAGLDEYKEEKTEQELSSRSKGNVVTIYKSSKENFTFKLAKNTYDIFAVGFVDQIKTGTGYNKGLKHILIEGMPGMGKTALAKEIAYLWATNEILNETKILFLLHLRDPQLQSVTTTKQLIEYMSMGCLSDEQITALNKHLVNMKGQQLCIVMDGFNEYPQKKSFIIDIINRTVLSEAIVIITSRPNAAVSLYNQVGRRFNIIGFSIKEQTQYVSPAILRLSAYDCHQKHNLSRRKHYFIPLYSAVSVCLFQLDISPLGTLINVIGLFILHAVYHHTLTLPHLIDQSQNTSKSITDTLYKLSELAFKGLQELKLVFTFDEIKQIYPHIDETVTRLGLLQTNEYYPYKRAGTNISFSFLHYTMQEFLAALHVSLLPGEQQSSWIQKTFWEDRYLFMWEMFDEIPNIIKEIRHRQYIKANVDIVIHTVITKVRNYRKDNDKHISFVKINLFPYHVSLLMFLISNLSIQWKILEIKYCMMTDIGMSILEGCISEKLSTLEYVDLSHNDSNPWGVYCAIIRHCNVKRLTLCGIKAYEMVEYVDGITNSLQMNKNLESLELRNILGNIKPILSCIVTHVEFNLPCREVVNRHYINETKLNIALKHKSDNSVPVSDNNRTVKVNLLCPRSCDSLTTENLNSLDVSNQGIDDYGVTIVTTFCDKYDIINLSNNRISHIGAATIGEYLKNNIFLLELNLSKNNIGPNGIIAIAKAIEVNASLQKFDISCCGVADDGAAAISNGLKCNHSLQELNLSQNEISNDGTKEIAETIQTNVTLRKLDISHNKTSDDGAAAISDSLKTNNSLQVLNISNNQITSSGAKRIAEAIQINSTLHTLYLHKSPVTEAQGALSFNLAVLNGVHLNNTLRKLTLMRVFGNDETLVNSEVEKINKQRRRQGSSKLEMLMKV